MEDDIHQRAVNLHARHAILVVDEAQLAKLVHEKTDTGASGADDLASPGTAPGEGDGGPVIS